MMSLKGEVKRIRLGLSLLFRSQGSLFLSPFSAIVLRLGLTC